MKTIDELKEETKNYIGTLVINEMPELAVFKGVVLNDAGEPRFALQTRLEEYWQKPEDFIIFLRKNIKDEDYGRLVHNWNQGNYYAD